jgi:hypothetical protein
MRAIVEGTSVVCSVENTRWPVSPAANAIRIDADLDLLNHRLLVGVLVLDRVFDRDDVLRIPLVDFVDDGRECRGLSRARGAADEDQPARQPRQELRAGRQVEARKRRHTGGQAPDRRRRPSALAVQVDPKAPDPGDPF